MWPFKSRPKVGEMWVLHNHKSDPWDDGFQVRVLDIQKRWVKYQWKYGLGYSTESLFWFMILFIKVDTVSK